MFQAIVRDYGMPYTLIALFRIRKKGRIYYGEKDF